MTVKNLLATLAVSLLTGMVSAQTKTAPPVSDRNIKKPRLVVGIVVDQMRYDYLFRYSKNYGENGFKRLMREGFLCRNARFNYVPTYTAPGHACIFTGTTPAYNGIISNDWYDVKSGGTVYCVEDSTVLPVGTTKPTGKMSPHRLLSTTITDELRTSNNLQSKVIGIALKDRGAILPAGHTANAAYWHDPNTNNWVTSSYYMKELPEWVQAFNRQHRVDTFLSKPWNTLLPAANYTESLADDNPYEGLYKGESRPVFPHDLPKIKPLDTELIRKTPFGNTYTREFAEAAIRSEKLGKGQFTDMLTVSFSSTDYVGHMFGIQSMEVEDTYLRLDREIADFLSFLDQEVGKGTYLLFLTADHGAAQNPEYMNDLNIPSGNTMNRDLKDTVTAYLSSIYGAGNYVLFANSQSIYLNHVLIDQMKLNPAEITERLIHYLLKFNGVAEVYSGAELARGECREGLHQLVQNGYNMKRSADVLIQLEPGWVDWYYKTGTTHGTFYSYDTHVPVIFFGHGITHGATSMPVHIEDIATTLAVMLDIEFPSAATGVPVSALIK